MIYINRKINRFRSTVWHVIQLTIIYLFIQSFCIIESYAQFDPTKALLPSKAAPAIIEAQSEISKFINKKSRLNNFELHFPIMIQFTKAGWIITSNTFYNHLQLLPRTGIFSSYTKAAYILRHDTTKETMICNVDGAYKVDIQEIEFSMECLK